MMFRLKKGRKRRNEIKKIHAFYVCHKEAGKLMDF